MAVDVGVPLFPMCSLSFSANHGRIEFDTVRGSNGRPTQGKASVVARKPQAGRHF